MAKKQVTAFELNPEVVGNTDAHPFTFGGFPGLWQVGRPMLPDALGLTVTRMRELIKEFNLPLSEVRVDEGDAHETFEVPAQHIPSGASAEVVQDQPRLLEVNGGLIPGPIPAGRAQLPEQAEIVPGEPVEVAETLTDETGAEEQGNG